MAEFILAHRFTAKWEGGLVDHPADPGGITHYGISLRWLRGVGLDAGDVDGDGDIDNVSCDTEAGGNHDLPARNFLSQPCGKQTNFVRF